jgi:hypothetical protein
VLTNILGVNCRSGSRVCSDSSPNYALQISRHFTPERSTK